MTQYPGGKRKKDPNGSCCVTRVPKLTDTITCSYYNSPQLCVSWKQYRTARERTYEVLVVSVYKVSVQSKSGAIPKQRDEIRPKARAALCKSFRFLESTARCWVKVVDRFYYSLIIRLQSTSSQTSALPGLPRRERTKERRR